MNLGGDDAAQRTNAELARSGLPRREQLIVHASDSELAEHAALLAVIQKESKNRVPVARRRRRFLKVCTRPARMPRGVAPRQQKQQEAQGTYAANKKPEALRARVFQAGRPAVSCCRASRPDAWGVGAGALPPDDHRYALPAAAHQGVVRCCSWRKA